MITRHIIADVVVAPTAMAFLAWAFGWQAAVAWFLVQTYANLRFLKE